MIYIDEKVKDYLLALVRRDAQSRAAQARLAEAVDPVWRVARASILPRARRARAAS